MLAVAAVMMQAVLVSPGFAPPLDAPLRIVTERVETSPGERRYRLERVARFEREIGGYRAQVRIVAAHSTGPAGLNGLVERGFAALQGRTLVIHFDDRGTVLSVDNLAQLWEQLCQGFAAGAAARRSVPPDQAAQLAARFAAPLRAFPEARQRDMLASLVTAGFASEPVEPAGVTRPVQLPGTSPFGTPVTLAGQRSSRRDADGLMIAETVAEASVTLPAEGANAARFGGTAVRRSVRFDSQTGRIVLASDTTRTIIGGGTDRREVLLVTTTHTERAPGSWPPR